MCHNYMHVFLWPEDIIKCLNSRAEKGPFFFNDKLTQSNNKFFILFIRKDRFGRYMITGAIFVICFLPSPTLSHRVNGKSQFWGKWRIQKGERCLFSCVSARLSRPAIPPGFDCCPPTVRRPARAKLQPQHNYLSVANNFDKSWKSALAHNSVLWHDDPAKGGPAPLAAAGWWSW